MIATIQRADGPRVPDWRELVESLSLMAEGYAATDPANGYLYVREASDFALLPLPDSEDELALREAAEAIKRRWGERVRQNKRP